MQGLTRFPSPSLCSYGLFARHQTCFPSHRRRSRLDIPVSVEAALCTNQRAKLPFLLTFVHNRSTPSTQFPARHLCSSSPLQPRQTTMRVFTTFPALSACGVKSNPWTRNPAVSGARSEILKGCLAYLALAPIPPPDTRCFDPLPLQLFGDSHVRDDATVRTPNSVCVKTRDTRHGWFLAFSCRHILTLPYLQPQPTSARASRPNMISVIRFVH
ncbi:hypothetical protein B0H14DRAFT_316818 [Mycena olivaceomarginata]|nr:hypothetical protein B0H14DRAFT_316818 [Mycena olivaceomarginata]